MTASRPCACFIGVSLLVWLGSGCAEHSSGMLGASSAGASAAPSGGAGGDAAVPAAGSGATPTGAAGQAPGGSGAGGMAGAPGAITADLGNGGALSFVPWPTNVVEGTGSIEISASTRIVAKTPELQPLAYVLSHELEVLTELALPVTSDAAPGDIVLELDASL
jgi:hypothetical protein